MPKLIANVNNKEASDQLRILFKDFTNKTGVKEHRNRNFLDKLSGIQLART